LNINIETEQRHLQERLEQLAARRLRVETELKDLREAELKLVGVLDYLYFQHQAQTQTAEFPAEETTIIQ